MFDFNLLFVVCFGVGVEGLKYVMVLGGIFYEGFCKGGGCLNPVCDLYGCFVFFDPF